MPAADLSGSSPALAQAVRQHAKTMQLLGVDFLPMRQALAPAGAAGPAHSAALPAQALVEAKPSAAKVSEPEAVATAIAPSAPAQAATGPMTAEQQSRQRLLDQLRARYEADAPHQQFVTDHHTIVFGEGDPCARLMFIGEAPGAEEDKVGRPFVGRAGQLLDKMITAMGLAREQVYIANVLKTRPPNNATPTLEEAAACAPYLYEQIAIVRPEAIVTLGLPATRLLLNSMEAMGRLRGAWSTYTPPAKGLIVGVKHRPVPVMPTYHPAFLLRSYTRDNRQKVWSDLQQVVARLGLEAPPGRGDPA